jgi:uncharacterized protein (TIGR00290 family)
MDGKTAAENGREIMKPKAWMAWSSGKDAAGALHVGRQRGDVDIVALLTTLTEAYGRVTMHGVREALVEAQAEAVGLPLVKVFIPTPCSNEVYEATFERVLAGAKEQGVTQVVFGDLFLADLRAWREAQLARIGMSAVFPIWTSDTASLARAMIRSGVKAYLTCIDPRKVPRELAGAIFDERLLDRLPEGVDPCGENGEFHSFCWDGPMFGHPVPVLTGETVARDGFVFTDLLPGGYPGEKPVPAPPSCSSSDFPCPPSMSCTVFGPNPSK